MNIVKSQSKGSLYLRSYKLFPFAKTKDIQSQNILQVTHLGSKVEPPSQRKKEVSETVPSARIIGLNFPVEKHSDYYKNQGERRASIAACHISPETSAFFKNRINHIAGTQLGLKVIPYTEAKDYDFILQFSTSKIQLATIEKAPLFNKFGPVFADFASGIANYRRRHGKYTPKSPIIRAVSVPGKTFEETHIIDATGGLGVDAFTLAFMGFKVTLIERDPIIFTLLQDGYQRGLQCKEIRDVLAKITLVNEDTFDYLKRNYEKNDSRELPDVIYLDPMYPHRDKVALPKKTMILARRFLPPTAGLEEFLEFTRHYCQHKVVLKRPYYETSENADTKKFKGRSTSFEIFPRIENRE
jgi:16S rRNA (guanine1516-N2)-methyltransferase